MASIIGKSKLGKGSGIAATNQGQTVNIRARKGIIIGTASQ